MKSFFLRNFPIITIAVIVLCIAVTNYSSGTFLTGGDNLHPEFDFGINIKRSIFSVWQEYQGLGLLGGMGHASDLLRQLFLLPFGLLLGMENLRWFWTFLTLFIGGAGAYYLFLNLIKRFRHEELIKNQLVALTGAMFYILNLSTIQSYFTPFEVFTAHFAFLPWLFLATINFFTKDSKKNLLLLSLVLFISTPSAYVPTLFLVYLLGSFIIGIFLIPGIKNFLKTYLKFSLIVTLINSFWLLPFLFFTSTSSLINVNAKINQMATDSIFLHNREFGHVWDVAILKGFWFNNVEPNLNGDYVYMLSAWREHLNNPLITVIGFGMFFIILLGIFATIRSKNRFGLGLVTLFAFTFIMLTTATPPFSQINEFVREYVPLFSQIFRFPFTKFSILASLIYAFFFCFGIDYIIRSRFHAKKNNYLVSTLLSGIIFIVFCLPAFRGEFFYIREQIKIPEEYFKTFQYFKDQDPNTRIANFPQYTFWGWNFYDWGYSGSGFIWYGINQPILDRAFDVWHKNNENYYWELNQALYSKNARLLESVLNKYDVNYLLVDKNIINFSSPKSLFIQEFEELTTEIPGITKEKDFGNIEIYKFNPKNKPNSYVSSLSNLTSVNSYNWTNFDQAYLEQGDYYTDDKSDKKIYYPFRNIFTGRGQKDIDFNVTESEDFVQFNSPLPEYKIPVRLNIPSLITQNNTLPIYIFARRDSNIVRLNFVLQTSILDLKDSSGQNTIWESKINKNLFETAVSGSGKKINVNGVSNFEIPDLANKEEKIIGTAALTITDNNSIVLFDSQNRVLNSTQISGESIREFFIQDEAYISLPEIEKGSSIIVKIPKIDDKYSSFMIDPAEKVKNKESEIVNCDNFRKNFFTFFIKEEDKKRLLELSSLNATPCVSFYLPTLDHDQAYLIRVENQNIKDQGLHFWVLNEDQKTALVDTFFEKNKGKTISTVVLPPVEKFGKSYSIHFDNVSIGGVEAGNLLGKIYVNPIPHHFLTNINIEPQDIEPQVFGQIEPKVHHPNQSLYMIETNNSGKKSAISLSQSYSPYWKAYEVNNFNILSRSFPFIFGRNAGEHVKINNWKNGWILEPYGNSKLIILYLPQYLQYLGFAISTGTLLVLIYLYIKEKKHRHKTPHNS